MRHRLRKAADHSKDQSYVLFPMQQDELARTLFPLGDLPKTETRRLAEELSPRMVGLIAELDEDWLRLDERLEALSAEIKSSP